MRKLKRKKWIIWVLDSKRNSRRRINISFMVKILIHSDPKVASSHAKIDENFVDYFFETKASKN